MRSSMIALSTALLSAVFFAAPAFSQKCSKPGYGQDAACKFGTDSYCDGARCLYETCNAGYYAQLIHEEGVIYDTGTANLCTACPGSDQTTDPDNGDSYGIGECYVPCGPAKCYVPSSGGTSRGAYQTGYGLCSNPAKGICEPTCMSDAASPIPDAYTIGNVCKGTKSRAARRSQQSTRAVKGKRDKIPREAAAKRNMSKSRRSYEEPGPYANVEGW